MKIINSILKVILCTFLFIACNDTQKKENKVTSETSEVAQENILAGWADTPKNRIISWVEKVTDSSSSDFIPVKDRIAVFDNDGTLWP
ncbi:MAG TPA: hypothetical protein VJ973_03555, partial [Christiangramia sp.]|nr:hypothetical protein [Christiangramia sp.]